MTNIGPLLTWKWTFGFRKRLAERQWHSQETLHSVESAVSCDKHRDFCLCGPSQLMKTSPALPTTVSCKWPPALRCGYSSRKINLSQTILRWISRRSLTAISALVFILHLQCEGAFSKCYLTTYQLLRLYGICKVWVWSTGLMTLPSKITNREKRKHREKTLSLCHFIRHKSRKGEVFSSCLVVHGS